MSYRMKRLAALLGCLTIAFAAVGCGDTVSQTTETTQESTLVETEKLDTSDMFSKNDKEVGYDEKTAEVIDLDQTTEKTITITEEGTYIVSGKLAEGQIVINAADKKVQLVLNNVELSCSTGSAILVEAADKVYVTMAADSVNAISNTGVEDAAIMSKDDICFNGHGSLTINSEKGNGIRSKNDLKVTSGTYTINAAGHGISAKDSVRIAEGSLTITSGEDGIHCKNDKESDKGYVYIEGGEFNIVSQGDGISASGICQIEDGDFNITTGGGSANAQAHTDGGFGGMKGDFNGQAPQAPADGTAPQAPTDGQAPQAPADGQAPQAPADGTAPQAPADGQAPQAPTDGQAPQDQSSTEATDNTSSDSSSQEDDSVSTKGIKAELAAYLDGGTITINSADDAIHAGSTLQIDEGSYSIDAGDDGLHADGNLVINGGEVTIAKSYEAIEGMTITINGGKTDVTASDDGLNASDGSTSTKGSMGYFENCQVVINGGYLKVDASGDGLDSNGDLTINGGEVYVEGPTNGGNSAIDYGDGGNAYTNGGTLIAVGNSGMAESFSDKSSQASMLVVVADSNITGDVVLTDSTGKEILSYTPSKEYNCVNISSPDLKSGETYTLKTGDITTEVKLEDGNYSNKTGGQQGGGFGGNGGKGGFGGPGRKEDNSNSTNSESQESTETKTL